MKDRNGQNGESPCTFDNHKVVAIGITEEIASGMGLVDLRWVDGNAQRELHGRWATRELYEKEMAINEAEIK